ncbi:MAG: trigger factor [Oscillospiraceae bacterium]|nr:trigger factor [Oscillospiraceae bacterium]
MSLTSSKKVETNKYELEIAVDKEAFLAAVDKVYRKNVKKITIPGFRKGKAPKSFIERYYGEGVFFEDAVNDLYPEAYMSAVKEAGIEPVAPADVEVLSVDKETGVSFKAIVIVKPEVAIDGYKGLSAEKAEVAVSDEEVTARLTDLQDRNARIITVEDRAAQNGDIAVINFKGFVDDVAFEGGEAEGHELTLGSGQFIPGFEDQIVGKNAGEEFDVNVTFPEDYHAEDLKAKPAVFKVKLCELKAKELPALDDDFAQDVSEFNTLDELKADILAKLTEQKTANADAEFENSLIDQVIEKLEAEIPEVMYDNAANDLLRDYQYRVQMQGLDFNTYLSYIGMNTESFLKTLRPQAEKQVKIRLALEKIAQIEALNPTEDELNEEFARLAENYGVDVEKAKELIPAEDIAKDLAAKKAIDLIKENAKVGKPKKAAAKKTTKKAAPKAEAAEEASAEETAEKKPAAKKTTTAKKTTAKKAAPKAEAAVAAPAEEAAEKKPATRKRTTKKTEETPAE